MRLNLIFLGINLIQNALQYVVQLALGQWLLPSDYGLYNAINSGAAIINTGGIVISYLVVELFLRHEGKAHIQTKFLTAIFGIITAFSALTMLATYVARANLMEYFKLTSSTHSLWLGGLAVSSLFLHFTIGVLQARRSYQSIAIQGLIASAMRLGLCFLLVKLASTASEGALGAGVISIGLATLYGWKKAKVSQYIALSQPLDWIPTLRTMIKQLPGIAVTMFCITFMANIDIPLVRMFCTEHESGMFSAAAIIGRTCLLIPGVLVFIIYPEALRKALSDRFVIPQLFKDLKLTFLISCSICLVIQAAPELILSVFYGEDYAREGASSLRLVAWSMSLLALLNIFFNYHLATKQYKMFIPTLACYVALMAYFSIIPPQSPDGIPTGMIVCFIAILSFEFCNVINRSSKIPSNQADKSVI